MTEFAATVGWKDENHDRDDGILGLRRASCFRGRRRTREVIDETRVVPTALQDPITKIVYYLESDGRHISAIGPDGKLIWTRDPFVETKLSPYQLKKLLICYFAFPEAKWWKIHSYLGKADEFIGINFNSSQFGVIKKTTGEFTFFGQD